MLELHLAEAICCKSYQQCLNYWNTSHKIQNARAKHFTISKQHL